MANRKPTTDTTPARRSFGEIGLGVIAPLALVFVLPSCAGKTLEGKVMGTQTRLQDAIGNGSKSIGCAPKETALAEANVKFAEEALRMGEYYRGKEHVILAGKYTEIAELKTDPVRCRAPGQVTPTAQPTAGDRDGDGYDDDADSCPDEAEDFDAFEDEDGCPDKDNDGDGVLDAARFENGTWVNLDQKDGVDCRNDPEDPDGFEDEDGCPDPDNDQDGILDANDQCPNDAEDIDQFEDEDGCPDPDNDQDGILDADDQCPLDPEDMDGDADEDGCPDLAVKVDPCAIKLDDKVYFEFNKWNVDPKSYKLLDDVVTVMRTNPDITIEIGGHTDSKGSDKYNKKLSQKRVDSVRTYLIDKGVKDTRVTAVGYGEGVPIDTNRTAEGRANNRRVEFNRTDNPECKK
ncbi:OmpA family protein [Pseudenhygromyxa sp. WMMC2535]|uniref:OmpA family protein n=1 Tax=Pseudenhygromyxa sp. WMMC2535 TaxID=2712867 RepID=UPI001551C38D|nr:OmpA family protein [Pseudenhygromyxa sp. WMMC2535]NVB42963.1 OmpA family protein [Pseudenhygromyxa sp. WMMC2535]